MREYFCYAKVRVAALGGRYEKMLTLAAEQGIRLQQVKAVPGGVAFCTAAKQYRQLAQLAKKCRTRLRLQKRLGLYFYLRRYKGRWGLLSAPAIFWLAVLLMSQMVWSVQWLGVEADLQPVLRGALYSMNIYEGCILTPDRIRFCEKKLVNDLPQLSWASLNFTKGRLVVEAAQNREKPEIEGNDPVDLVAKEGGVVVLAQAEEGILLKKSGQTVAKGEVLIAAGRADREGRIIPTHAKGQVIAQVTKTYRCSQPLSYWETIPIGKTERRKQLLFAGKKIPLYRKNSQLPSADNCVYQPVTVLGLPMPATIEESLWVPRQQKNRVLTEQSAQQRARLACLTQLFLDFQDAKILAQQVKIDRQEAAICCTLTVQFEADIAKAAL